MFLEISQNSQENTSVRVSFSIKLQAQNTSGDCFYEKIIWKQLIRCMSSGWWRLNNSSLVLIWQIRFQIRHQNYHKLLDSTITFVITISVLSQEKMDKEIKNAWFPKAFQSLSIFFYHLTSLGHGGVCVSLYHWDVGF